MARVTFKRAAFTGSVGPVAFKDGEAETTIPAMLVHFRRDPGRYIVHDDEQPERDPVAVDGAPQGPEPGAQPQPGAPGDPDDTPDPDPDPDPQPAPQPEQTAPAYRERSRADLRELAAERGLPVGGTRDELADRLTAAHNRPNAEGAEQDDQPEGDDTGE